MLTQDLFIHHVYFWLDNPESEEDHAALLAGLQALSKVPSIQQFHIADRIAGHVCARFAEAFDFFGADPNPMRNRQLWAEQTKFRQMLYQRSFGIFLACQHGLRAGLVQMSKDLKAMPQRQCSCPG